MYAWKKVRNHSEWPPTTTVGCNAIGLQSEKTHSQNASRRWPPLVCKPLLPELNAACIPPHGAEAFPTEYCPALADRATKPLRVQRPAWPRPPSAVGPSKDGGKLTGGAQRGPANCKVSTFLLISCKDETVHTGLPPFSDWLKPSKTVAAARRRHDVTNTAPSHIFLISSPSLLSTNSCSFAHCARPSSLSGESKKSESMEKRSMASRHRAHSKVGKNDAPNPRLKHSFHALSP
mmetsp:Transcript_4563/g.11023  ORF Transcript_4563/g.11023 Transcript_4563/m.11023 type:complete len:234 (+) Transcript_4563:272-973(+)